MNRTGSPIVHLLPALAPALTAALLAIAAAPAPADTDREAADYRRHLAFLASESLQGRLPGTPGAERAAAYAELHLAAAGLEPLFTTAGSDPSFRQRIEIEARPTLESASVTLLLGDESIELEQGTDFSPLGYGSGGSGTAPVTFAGYSIVAGQDGYLGYKITDRFDQAAALILRYEPMDDEGQSLWTQPGQAWTFNSNIIGKLAATARRGASAVFITTPPAANTDDDTGDSLQTLAESIVPPQAKLPIPVFELSTEAAAQLVSAGAQDDQTLASFTAASNESGTFIPLVGSATIRFESAFTESASSTDNIGGLIPGRGALANQLILIGAHYDHIGDGENRSRDPESQGQTHPGADDNASGAAAALVLARSLATEIADLPAGTPARSIAVVLFTGGDSEQRGSRLYTREPPRPLRDHALMINLDQIGRYEGLADLRGADSGENLPAFITPIAQLIAIERGLDLADVSAADAPSNPSDDLAFLAARVPAITLTTGDHDDRYTPRDTPATLNTDAAIEITRLARDLALAAVTRKDPIEFVGSPDRTSDPAGDDPDAPAQPRVRVGIATRSSEQNPGITVARVFDDSPAAAAGLQPGDRIITWNGEDVQGSASWFNLILNNTPGDTVTAEVIRRGEPIELDITLE